MLVVKAAMLWEHWSHPLQATHYMLLLVDKALLVRVQPQVVQEAITAAVKAETVQARRMLVQVLAVAVPLISLQPVAS